jgi:hypothetical protein
MSEVNPAGTMFVELIAELMGLLANPNVSNVEVVMANYELDVHGQRKMENGKEVVVIRPFAIRGMDKGVQNELRNEYDSGPITRLIVLWIDRTRTSGPFGMLFFDVAGKERAPGVNGMDHLEKKVLADYLNRQVKGKERLGC